MGEFDIGAAQTSNYDSTIDKVEIPSAHLDSPQSQKETEYYNTDFYNQMGIYKNVPEFKIAVDMRAIWVIGDKVETPDGIDEPTVQNIIGWGKSTFREILKNMLRVKRIAQDSYAEIIRDEEGNLINLKVLNNSRIKEVYNDKGMLLRYEEIEPTKENKVLRKFKPYEIFHLTSNRICDEMHGIADSSALKKILEALNENFEDVRKMMHRHVKPIMKYVLDTDDDTEINAFIAKADKLYNRGDNVFVPKDTVEHELIAVPSNATLNPLPWRDSLKDYFYQVCGMPQIITGSSGEFTESTAKIAYLAFEQSVKDEQTDIVEQVWDQLQIRIKLTFPASLKNELLSDENKDGPENIDPSDVTAGVGR